MSDAVKWDASASYRLSKSRVKRALFSIASKAGGLFETCSCQTKKQAKHWMRTKMMTSLVRVRMMSTKMMTRITRVRMMRTRMMMKTTGGNIKFEGQNNKDVIAKLEDTMVDGRIRNATSSSARKYSRSLQNRLIKIMKHILYGKISLGQTQKNIGGNIQGRAYKEITIPNAGCTSNLCRNYPGGLYKLLSRIGQICVTSTQITCPFHPATKSSNNRFQTNFVEQSR